MLDLTPSSIEATVHLIQVALTPVFLLSGIAALLNVFAGRLARVADRLDALAAQSRSADAKAAKAIEREIAGLHKRSVALDWAVVLGSVGAAAICLNILTLFVLSISAVEMASVLLLFFAIAVVCTLGSVGAFLAEMLMSSSILRARMSLHVPDLALLGWRRRR
jgi:uncharacterized membrane protein